MTRRGRADGASNNENDDEHAKQTDEDEMGSVRAGGGAGRMIARLLESDADNDGVIAKAEVSDRMQGLFDRLDGNNDGKLDPKEIEEARERSQGGGDD